MEKKQLNFSAPLMSARRYSSPLRTSGEQERRISPPKNPKSIPPQTPDVHLSEVVKPGSVPFVWEQIPGKAKGSNAQLHNPREKPTIPHLPPSMPFPPGKRSGELNGFRAPNKLSGELCIPRPCNFSGEFVNLRPRNKLSGELCIPRPRNFSGELVNLRPRNKLSGELNIPRPQKFSGEINSFRPYSKLSGELEVYASKDMVRWDSSKEWTDMIDSSESEDDTATFSDAIETFSQLESFSINCSVSGVSQSELPVTEPPETKLPNNLPTDPKTRDFMMNRFLPAAKAMTIEPSQYASRKQLVAVEKPKEVKALIPRAMTPPPNPNMCKIVPYSGQDIGSEESEEEEDIYEERSTLSVKVKACGFLPWFCAKNSLRLVNPLPSMKVRSKSILSSASKLSKLVKTKSLQAPTQKLVKDPYSNPKQVRQVYKSCELQKVPKYTPRPMFYSGELQTRNGSPYRNSRRSNVSPFQNNQLVSCGVNQSKVPGTGLKRFEEPGRKTRGSRTRTPMVEKTHYVDSVNIAKVSHSILNIPKTKRQVDLSVEEAVRLEYGGRLELLKARGRSGPLVYSGFDSSESSRISEKENTNTCRDLVLVPSDDAGTMQSSLTLPLPKAPSESWLSRQFPSASPRVSVSYSSMNSKMLSRKQSAPMPATGAKWENIVKGTHLRLDHGRYSEELVSHAPQQARIWK